MIELHHPSMSSAQVSDVTADGRRLQRASTSRLPSPNRVVYSPSSASIDHKQKDVVYYFRYLEYIENHGNFTMFHIIHDMDMLL